MHPGGKLHFKRILQVLSLPGRKHGIAFERDHFSRVQQHRNYLFPSTTARGGPGRAPGHTEHPNAASPCPGPYKHRPGPCELTRPLGLPWGPCPAPRAELGPSRPSRCYCGQSMTNFTRSPAPLLAKTSRFLPVPEAAPWDLPACRRPPAIPGGTRGDRGPTHAGEGEAAAGWGRGTADRKSVV